MILICYDIRNNRNRLKLSKYLEKYGRRLQFSIFEIDQHYSILNEIKANIKLEFAPRLRNNDSILIVPMMASMEHKIIRHGAKIQKEKQYITICA
jgi:CRISPR-associated protein Cas2